MSDGESGGRSEIFGAIVNRILDTVESTGAVDFDGLTISRVGDAYHIETPTFRRTELRDPDLPDAFVPAEEFVTNWWYWTHVVRGPGTARRAFLRRCERARIDDGDGEATLSVSERYDALATGIERTWGELKITARFAADSERRGDRVYDLGHVSDEVGEPDPTETLDLYDDPRAARDLATTDRHGRYRPLKTAPTLEGGWAFVGLSGDELVDAIDYFYPATIANWYRERRGALDVDHWLETANRQSGMYDPVDELSREAVEWATAACCVDEACLKRREWHYEPGDELETDPGLGAFPCREPCSVLIAAAREWATLESETEYTWTFELTLSEKNQLEALIDAVADGWLDEIREADFGDGANRYRARYLRAKRFDEDGNLCGVDSPSEDEDAPG